MRPGGGTTISGEELFGCLRATIAGRQKGWDCGAQGERERKTTDCFGVGLAGERRVDRLIKRVPPLSPNLAHCNANSVSLII